MFNIGCFLGKLKVEASEIKLAERTAKQSCQVKDREGVCELLNWKRKKLKKQ